MSDSKRWYGVGTPQDGSICRVDCILTATYGEVTLIVSEPDVRGGVIIKEVGGLYIRVDAALIQPLAKPKKSV